MGTANWAIVNDPHLSMSTAAAPLGDQTKAVVKLGPIPESMVPQDPAGNRDALATEKSDVRSADTDKAAFTIPEACKYCGLSRSYLYALFEQKALPRLKAGKRVLILRRDLDDYLISIREGAKG